MFNWIEYALEPIVVINNEPNSWYFRKFVFNIRISYNSKVSMNRISPYIITHSWMIYIIPK